MLKRRVCGKSYRTLNRGNKVLNKFKKNFHFPYIWIFFQAKEESLTPSPKANHGETSDEG